MHNEKPYWHAFSLITKLGTKRLQKIYQLSGNNIEKAWKQPHLWIKHCIQTNEQSSIYHQIKQLSIENCWTELRRKNIETVTIFDNEYPYWLKQIDLPPYILYYQGVLPKIQQQLITIIGTRNISRYGQEILDNLIPVLAQQGFAIISGLAFGTDAYAHELSLKHNAYTLAVLASGVDEITPRSNTHLAKRIIEKGGCIVSEEIPGTLPHKGSFPKRNRILSALSPLTLVIEAGEKSGSKITANFALHQNREVACIPGPIFSEESKGCNQLIRDGAHCITKIQDLLHLYGLDQQIIRAIPSHTPTPEQYKIIDALKNKPLSIEEIQIETQSPIPNLMMELTELEIHGIIDKHPSLGYKLCTGLTFV